jgi:putative transposase
MARLARAVAIGIPHHITQRGNQRQVVFHHDDDRRLYLALLSENARRHAMRLLGYCLMSNHVHIIAVPDREDSLAKALGRTHADYARWLHIRQHQTGHLWQNRFYSCPLDEGHCWAALRYVECNPARAGMVDSPWDWPWSRAAAHVAAADPAGMLDLREWRTSWTGSRWKEAIGIGIGEAQLAERIRLATRTGRPLGTRDFAVTLERVLGRSLMPAKRGRKNQALVAQVSGV